MEYTQWVGASLKYNLHLIVLILVVMEYTQWVTSTINLWNTLCLNPCCNGIYSMRIKKSMNEWKTKS